MTVVTDIEDEEFLAPFRDGVAADFVHAPAARAWHFSVALKIRRFPPGEPNPEGAPDHAAAITTKARLEQQ